MNSLVVEPPKHVMRLVMMITTARHVVLDRGGSVLIKESIVFPSQNVCMSSVEVFMELIL
jgi:hypothetical protein